ncbi:hypothetical protein TELCIR_25097 [Teladorsagia circumcincta]|uniref:Uncharacterized protein n=1 Tax=Teladorsagia circumcincta TaxID=45464 RepID=A0A2G9T6J7_TELCI|nr:hypothetical protein TELCIR_25097 [Teladorsagia circumcincta]
MLAGQQQEINRALLSVTHRDADVSRVEEGISTIKSLLLSHNNFAPIIVPTAKAAQLPSWQRQQAESSSPASVVNSGYTTPPANYKNGTDELGSDEALSSDSV